jgi:hypothetical protein
MILTSANQTIARPTTILTLNISKELGKGLEATSFYETKLRSARVLYAQHEIRDYRIWFFMCRKCAGIIYQSTMGHRWDRSARRIEKLRARLQWSANGTVPIKPRGMHERTYQRILGMLAYHEAIRKQGAGYARKERLEEHRTRLWRQCRNRFGELGGWPVRYSSARLLRKQTGPP